MSKILFLDIETKPILAYTWGLFNQNISLDQIVQSGGILCVGAKWLGKKGCEFYSEWEHGQEGMLSAIHKMMCEADAVVTYNGDSFDLPRLKGQFALIKLPPVPPLTSIDVLKNVRKLGLTSNKLAFVGPFFSIGKKVKNAGWQLWIDVLNGSDRARYQMQRYCVGDVLLLERVYTRLKPYFHNHPNMGNGHNCGRCGSHNTQSRGWRLTQHYRVQRIQCQSCGSWGEGRKEKIT